MQVFVDRVEQKCADSKFRVLDKFQPMNLLWAHTGEVFSEGIAPRMGQHCDLGYVYPPGMRHARIIRPAELRDGKTHFQMQTQVRPYIGSSSLEPGDYEIHLLVAASNAEPHGFVVELKLSGDWLDDARQMFSKGIGVTVRGGKKT
ncbi:hypothetical protein [Methylotetracoccus oryzae]|uniref:hypothetical protein n=1 Tax=Methylotetracoccus oryzae TaxID=1919059 RepID=UPI0011194CB5|nr:hypothetical protein [Methylotetracoccus oryzae]